WSLWMAEAPTAAVLIATSLAMVAVAFGAGALASRYVLRRLQQILQAMLQIAQGQRGVHVQVHGKGELSELAHALNYMSREVTAYEDEQRALLARVQQGCMETVRALVSAIHARDPYTRGHANRVARLSVLVARELGVSADALADIEFGGILHDVGKIGIRD